MKRIIFIVLSFYDALSQSFRFMGVLLRDKRESVQQSGYHISSWFKLCDICEEVALKQTEGYTKNTASTRGKK